MVPVRAVAASLIGSAPSAITCRSMSDTSTCKAAVGVKFAPDKSAISTALSVPNVFALVSQ